MTDPRYGMITGDMSKWGHRKVNLLAELLHDLMKNPDDRFLYDGVTARANLSTGQVFVKNVAGKIAFLEPINSKEQALYVMDFWG